MIVCKFGGTPMADSKNVAKVINMILSDRKRRIVVVSAPGARFKGDKKVTDLLIAAADTAPDSNEQKQLIKEIVFRFSEIAGRLGADLQKLDAAVEDLERRLASKDRNNARRMDLIKAYGEEWAARIMAEILVGRGVKARFVDPREAGIVVTPEFGNSELVESSYKKIALLAKTREILIVPGFYGFTKAGETATFSRGGSDLTGSILAAAVRAEVYENFSDVPGVYAANPKVVKKPKPRIIPKLTFRELRELAYSGFSVFHDEAVQPILKYAPDVPIHVRHFAYPNREGTWIVKKRKAVKGEIAGIAADYGFISVNVDKHMMNREIGFGRRLLAIFEKRNISYEHSPSSIDSISVIIKMKKKGEEKMLEEIAAEIRKTLKPDTLKIENDLAMIAIVGEGMKRSVGIAARSTAAFAQAGVNIEMISQGASEISIVFGVKKKDAERAVRSIYKKLVLNA